MASRSGAKQPVAPDAGQPIVPIDLIFGSVVWFGLAAVIAWAFVPHPATLTDMGKAIGAGLGIATAIFAPISGIVMAKYQAQLTYRLESLKADYTSEIEQLRSSLAAGLEVKKALIAARIRAFDSMLTSAYYFYFILRQMTFGDFEEAKKLLSDADKRAAEASSVVWHLSQEDRNKWFSVYHQSITLAGRLVKETGKDERTKIFNSNATALGKAMEELEQAGLAAFAEADSNNLKISDDEFRISGRPLIQ